MSYWRCQPDMKYIHRHLNEFRKFKFQSDDNSSDQKDFNPFRHEFSIFDEKNS